MSLSRNHWWETLDQMVRGVCLNSLVNSKSRSVKLVFSKSQRYKAPVLLQVFQQACKCISVYISSAVARQCHSVSWTGLWESFIMSIESFSSWGWVQTVGKSKSCGWSTRKAGVKRQLILFFCEYLTWIIQIWTCWSIAGCPFYSHSFRESTENTLQHSRSGSKRRKESGGFF